MIDMKRSRAESQSSLLNRRSRAVNNLPALQQVLRGSLLRRKIRCGKPNCRCAQPKGRLHVLLCVTVSLPAGRTQQVTVPPEWAGSVRRWIENYRRYWQAIEEVSAVNRRLLQLRLIPGQPALRGRRSAARRERQRKGPSPS